TLLAGLIWSGGLFYPLLFVEDGTWAERLTGLAALTLGTTLFLFAFLVMYRITHPAPAERSAWRSLWVAPALWIGLEYLMRWGAVGFSTYLGVTQWEMGWARGLAAYGGIHGVAALLVAASACVVEVGAAWSRNRPVRVEPLRA